MTITNFEQNLERVEQSLDSLRRALAGARERFGEGLQLTRTQIEILIMLAEKPRTTGDMAGQLFLTQSAVTQTIDTLVRRGLVVRVPFAEDRRVVRLQLTSAGRKLTGDICALRRRHMERLLNQLSGPEVEALLSIAQKMTGLFNESGAEFMPLKN